MGTKQSSEFDGEENNIPTPDIIAAYEPGAKKRCLNRKCISWQVVSERKKNYHTLKSMPKQHSPA